jgi:histidyl-tRNA synthetase
LSDVRTPRGTRDLIGAELENIRRVTEVLSSVFQRFGYLEVETPIFEHLELFTRKSGSEIVRQLYAFKDKSGRDLALRPELTAPVIRLYLQRLKSEPKPLKLCYFGSCFRYEEPQAWRWRQFFQAGAEIIGTKALEADVEVVLTAWEAMRELGFKRFELRVGNVGILRGVLRNAGVNAELQDPILRAVDSHDAGRISAELQKAGIQGESAEKLKKLFSLRGSQNVLEKLPEETQKNSLLFDFRKILELLSAAGVDFTLDLGIARGLDYYTGFVFEVYVDGVQVAGGGRYDGLVEVMGGSSTPATGVGFGVDRISKALLERGMRSGPLGVKAMVIPVSKADFPEACQVALELRRVGIPTELELASRKLSKALAHANALGVKKAIILGSRERAAGEALVRDMQTGEQERIELKTLASRLKSIP